MGEPISHTAPAVWNEQFNGRYVGVWSETYWSMGSYTVGPTYSYTVDITSGVDDLHNNTTISYCPSVQFDSTGHCMLYKGQIFERNDSLIYGQQTSGGLGGGTNCSFKGKKL